MSATKRDKAILGELAKRCAEIAALPEQAERRNRATAINDLKPSRPIVWIDEIPWHEMDIDGNLGLTCGSEPARRIESHFRRILYRWDYIRADMVAENEFPVYKTYNDSEPGVEIKENKIVGDEKNNIYSHMYLDQLPDFESVERLRLPALVPDAEADRHNVGFAEEMLGGALPVKLKGHSIYHAPWDNIPRLHGVQQTLIDLYERPELMHAARKKFSEIGLSQMRQLESAGLLDDEPYSIHCTPAYVSGLKPSEPPVKLKNVWFRGMAQMFGDVSPAMFDEFDLQYMKPLMAMCGLTYYGCCESLQHKIPLLKTVPNLRKIGVSPWADPEACAEQIGGGYVYAHKPNPANVSGRFRPEAVRAEIRRVIETCLRNGCPYEFVLKDISTVTYKPGNLIEWTKTVMDTIDEYYK